MSSYSVSDRIKRFREAPASSREERNSREFELTQGGATAPINPRMWWEETTGTEPALKYDSDILGADESIGYSGDYDNKRRVVNSKAEMARRTNLSNSLDTSLSQSIEQSAIPLASSTVPIPQPMSMHGFGSATTAGGMNPSRPGPLHRSKSVDAPAGPSKIRDALRDTSELDIALEDSYSHLQSKQPKNGFDGNTGRGDRAREKQGHSPDLQRVKRPGASADYSSTGFYSHNTTASQASILIDNMRQSREMLDSQRTSLASQENSGVGANGAIFSRYSNNSISFRNSKGESDDYNMSFGSTTGTEVAAMLGQRDEQKALERNVPTAIPKSKYVDPTLSAARAALSNLAAAAGLSPVKPEGDGSGEEDAYGSFKPYNTYDSHLLGTSGKPASMFGGSVSAIAPKGSFMDAQIPKHSSTSDLGKTTDGTGTGTGTGTAGLDLGASFAALLDAMKEDEERIERIIKGEIPDDGKGNMGILASNDDDSKTSLVATADSKATTVDKNSTVSPANIGDAGKAVIAAVTDGLENAVASAVGAMDKMQHGNADHHGFASGETEASVEAALNEKREKHEDAIRTRARYEEQWRLLGEEFSKAERARDGNMQARLMHEYEGYRTTAAASEREADKLRKKQRVSAIAIEHNEQLLSTESPQGAAYDKAAKQDAAYGARLDLGLLAVNKPPKFLNNPFSPTDLKADNFREYEAEAFRQAREQETRELHELEHAYYEPGGIAERLSHHQGRIEGYKRKPIVAPDPKKHQQWEGLNKGDMFFKAHPRPTAFTNSTDKIDSYKGVPTASSTAKPSNAAAAAADGSERVRTSVPGLTAPAHRAQIIKSDEERCTSSLSIGFRLAGEEASTNGNEDYVTVPEHSESNEWGGDLDSTPKYKTRANSTRYDRSTGPGSFTSKSAKAAADVTFTKYRVFQKGRWEERTHSNPVNNSETLDCSENMDHNRHGPHRIFEGGKWRFVGYPEAEKSATESIPEFTAPMVAASAAVKKVANEHVAASIQSAISGYLIGSTPGSPNHNLRKEESKKLDSTAAHMAAAVAMGAVYIGTDKALHRKQNNLLITDAAESLSRSMIESVTSKVLERISTKSIDSKVCDAGDSRGGAFPLGVRLSGKDSRVKHGNSRHTNSNIKHIISENTQESGDAVAAHGYKVFQRGQWVILNHHEDAAGVPTNALPVTASALKRNNGGSLQASKPGLSSKALSTEDSVRNTEPKVESEFEKDSGVVDANVKGNHELLPNQLGFPTGNHSNNPLSTKASGTAAIDETTSAELELQKEIERIRHRLEGTGAAKRYEALVAEAKNAVAQSTNFTSIQQTPQSKEDAGRTYLNSKNIEDSSISGGHVVVPPPMSSQSLATRSRARDWGIFTDGYSNDASGHYTRWGDDMGYANDYDSNNLEKVFAHIPSVPNNEASTGHVISIGASMVAVEKTVFASPAAQSAASADVTKAATTSTAPPIGDQSLPPGMETPAFGDAAVPDDEAPRSESTSTKQRNPIQSLGASFVESVLGSAIRTASDTIRSRSPSPNFEMKSAAPAVVTGPEKATGDAECMQGLLDAPSTGDEAAPEVPQPSSEVTKKPSGKFQRPPQRKAFAFAAVEAAAVDRRLQRQREIAAAAHANAVAQENSKEREKETRQALRDEALQRALFRSTTGAYSPDTRGVRQLWGENSPPNAISAVSNQPAPVDNIDRPVQAPTPTETVPLKPSNKFLQNGVVAADAHYIEKEKFLKESTKARAAIMRDMKKILTG